MANNDNPTHLTAVRLELGTFTHDMIEVFGAPSYEASDFFVLALDAGSTYTVDVIEEAQSTILPAVAVMRLPATEEEENSGLFPTDGYPGELDGNNRGDDTDVGNNIRLFFTATATADHWFNVFASLTVTQDFGYAIRVSRDIADTGTVGPTLAAGESITSILHSAADVDRFNVELTAGRTYTFTIAAADGEGTDGEVKLFQGTTVVASHSGTGAPTSISFTPTTSGTYSLAAMVEQFGAAGSYTVSMQERPADIPGDTTTTATLAPGGSVSAAIDTVGDVDAYRLTVTAGQTYTVNLGRDGSGIDTVLRLLDASGNLLVSNDDRAVGDSDSTLVFRAVRDGTFLVTASEFANGTGDYQLSMIAGATANMPLRHIGSSLRDAITGGSGTDHVFGFDGNDTLSGGVGNDSLVGGNGNDRLNGDADNDQILGDAGRDSLAGGIGNDVMLGGADNDTLVGDAGNDVLNGNEGNDSLVGGIGTDTLAGGTGRDMLTGGAGKTRDVFVFNSVAETGLGKNRDVIRDFQTKIDDIDLLFVDANTGLVGDQAFLFSGTRAAAHSVWYVKDAGNLIVRFDVDGNTRADGEISLLGVKSLAAGDFIL